MVFILTSQMYYGISVLAPVLVRVPEYVSTSTSISTITLELTHMSKVQVAEIQYLSTASTSTSTPALVVTPSPPDTDHPPLGTNPSSLPTSQMPLTNANTAPAVRETSARPHANVSAFKAGRVENWPRAMNFQWKKRFREMALWACAVARVPGKLGQFA